MTENESVLITLQNAIECATDDITKEDLEMMVKCLEELQQYRAIGTVEEFKALKENQFFNFDSPVARIDKKSYDKAIDDFAEKLKYELNGNIIPDKEKFTYARKQQEQICHQNTTLKRAIKYVDYIAEQLKGENNE